MPSAEMYPPSAEILGVRVHALTMPLTMNLMASWIQAREPHYICVTPAHAIMDYRRDPALLKIANESGLTTPDGMSIVWLLRQLGYPQVERVYGPDLLLAACEYGLSSGWRHFFYGGTSGVADNLSNNLKVRFPNLQTVGTYTPPFHPLETQEEIEVINTIRTAEPDIVWVGLSTPKQERWMAKYLQKLQVPVLAGIGAAFDFLSGTKPHAPRWVQQSGLEWLFRLLSEPRRLWRRYAEYPYFAWLVAQQMWQKRGKQSEDR